MKTRQNQDKSAGRPARDKASPRVPASPPGRESCERVVTCVSRRFLPLQSSPAGVGQAVNRTDGQTHPVNLNGAQQRQFETTRKLNSRKLPASTAGAAGSRPEGCGPAWPTILTQRRPVCTEVAVLGEGRSRVHPPTMTGMSCNRGERG